MESKVIAKCPHCRRDILLSLGAKEQGSADIKRDIELAAAFIAGSTSGELASKYGISRERVRQILDKLGIKAEDGGQKVKIANKVERSKKFCKCGKELLKYQRTFCTDCAKTERTVKARKYNKASKLKKQLEIANSVRDVLVDVLANKG